MTVVMKAFQYGESTVVLETGEITRAAPMGPLNGIPERHTAADAPMSAGISGSMSGSNDSTVAMT